MASSFKKLLDQHASMRSTLVQAQRLIDLQQQFAAVVPSYLAQVTTVVDLYDGNLKLVVSNQTIAAKLKQMAPDLVEKLNKRGREVSRISIKVQVSLSDQRTKPERHLGPIAKQSLLELDEHLADSPLKRALSKLRKTP